MRQRKCFTAKRRALLPALVRIQNIPFLKYFHTVPLFFGAEIVLEEYAGNRNLSVLARIGLQALKTIVTNLLRVELTAIVALSAVVAYLIRV